VAFLADPGKLLNHQQIRANLDARSAPGAVMCDEQKDLAYFLGKAEDYRKKASRLRVVQRRR
jgi:hypothetical protein